ncbi:MAG: GAF domain-containing protein [Bacteroidota bacterium]
MKYTDLDENVDQLKISTLEAHDLIQQFTSRGFKEEEFLLTGDSPLLAEIRDKIRHQDSLLNLMGEYDYFHGSASQELDNLKKQREQFVTEFDELIGFFDQRGFKDHGIEGKLRSAIHKVEDLDLEYDRVLMLTLRRHEKDFFLRKDLKYLTRFNETIDEFKANVQSSDTLSSDERDVIFSNVSEYQKLFSEIVEVEQKIGFSPSDGQQGKLNGVYNTIDNDLKIISGDIKRTKASFIDRSFVYVLSLLVIQIVVGLLLITFYSSILTKAIKEIRSAIVQLSQGSFPKPLIIRTKDEVGQAKNALNQLIARIREAVGFARKLGEGDLDMVYSEQFREDVLAKAIITTQEQLQIADRQQKKVNWTNHGLALFADILNNDTHSIQELGDQIIQQIVKYLEANQGAIYVIEEDEIERVATYAYSRKKYVSQSVKAGQGLLGQTILEGETLFMTDIPNGYTNITSGLGASTPSSLVIIPLKNNERVVGAIELASFKVFETHEIQLLEKLSENIAAVLISKQIESRTIALLEDMKKQSVVMASLEAGLNEKSRELDLAHAEIEQLQRQKKHEIERLSEELEAKGREILRLEERKKLVKQDETSSSYINLNLSL